MPTLKTIRKRITAVKNTKKLTRAMRMIAAAKLKKAQSKAIDARVYNQECSKLLNEIIKSSEQIQNPLFEAHEELKKVMDLIIFSSDRGLCGTFNENLLRSALVFTREKIAAGYQINYFVFGKKGRDFLKSSGVQPVAEYIHLTGNSIKPAILELLNNIKTRFLNKESCEAVIAYNKFKGVGKNEPSFTKIFPLIPDKFEYEHSIENIYEPDKNMVVGHLATEVVSSNIFQAYFESAAGELASRMVSMDKATKNAEDLIISLTGKYNRARQATITRELIDIVGGAQAVL